MVELAGEGNEGAVYGMVGSVTNMALPLASTLTKYVNSHFDVTNTDIADDSNHVRWEVTKQRRNSSSTSVGRVALWEP
ncbi:hypothetical protein PR003_g29384 [Phytophthora rubi]|uniref:Uncharacterized protein n=1 Tax=Phytophthora rubi TaxID=129364 RepID=A0A6A4BKE2_9STRA|nr:hypothetical protein PR003_g29384 [Phytophthora rubi]